MNKRLVEALNLANNNQMEQALGVLATLENDADCGEKALQLTIKIALAKQDYVLAKSKLVQLCQLTPNNFNYLTSLAELTVNQHDCIIVCQLYHVFLNNNPYHAIAWFNYAYYLKKSGEFELAISSYQEALKLNISDKHELYLNMSVIYADHLRDDNKAKHCLEKALEINPKYTNAMYNLANLFEQQGDKENAYRWFSKAYEIDDTYTDALARLADLKCFSSEDDPVIKQLLSALNKVTISDEQRCNLLFALGKAFNDCKSYDKAFTCYTQGNEIDKRFYPKYDKTSHSQYIDGIIQHYPASQFTCNSDLASENAPIFICGMFRSGSTLTEQVLAAHPDVTAGGEIDFFPRYISASNLSYPKDISALSSGELKKIAGNYLTELNNAFPGADVLTDKRPDNYQYIGLIKQLFPKAKVVFTERNMLDNCLSVFFLRLGASMNYSSSLKDAVHYYQEQQRLLRHWQSLFGEDIFVCHYDNLIAAPQSTIRNLLAFLGLPWSDSCLEFYKVKNTVKTASVWQVRQPLYTSSSGRWKNFSKQLQTLGLKLPIS